MNKNIVHQLHSEFERCAHSDEATGVEYWFARDLQKLLGYSQWRNFEPVIEQNVHYKKPLRCSRLLRKRLYRV
jgi:DNA-damage-inducible protein D